MALARHGQDRASLPPSRAGWTLTVGSHPFPFPFSIPFPFPFFHYFSLFLFHFPLPSEWVVCPFHPCFAAVRDARPAGAGQWETVGCSPEAAGPSHRSSQQAHSSSTPDSRRCNSLSLFSVPDHFERESRLQREKPEKTELGKQLKGNCLRGAHSQHHQHSLFTLSRALQPHRAAKFKACCGTQSMNRKGFPQS